MGIIQGTIAVGTTGIIMGLVSPQSTNTADKETEPGIPAKAA